MDMSLLCTADQTLSSPALAESQPEDLDLSLSHSSKANMPSGTETVSGHSDPTDKPTEPLSNVCKSFMQEKHTDSDCSRPTSSSCNMSECFPLCSEPSLNDDFMFHACFSSSDPQFLSPSQNLFSPPTKCESGHFFSCIKELSTTQTSGALSSICEGLTEPSITEPLSSYGFGSASGQSAVVIRPLTPQSDSLESDAAIAPVSDLYIFERETSHLILNPSVMIECPEYQPLTHTGVKGADGGCGTPAPGGVTPHHHDAARQRATVGESDVIQQPGLRPPAVDSCEASLITINDATQQKAEVRGLALPWLSDSPVELWLDACQYLAEEDREDRDVLDETGRSVIQEGLSATSDLSFLPGETQVSIYNPEVSEAIGWSSDDTRGWRPAVKRWSSVDSWVTALSDWTGILASPPEDLTAAFTEIGAEIEALTQALADERAHSDPVTQSEGQTAVQEQSQPPMGVQDQPPEVPSFSELSRPERQDREDFIQTTRSLHDLPPITHGEKESEGIQSTQAECSPCSIHQLSSMSSSCASVASSGGCHVDVTAVTLIPGNLDLFHFHGYAESLETDISNDGDQIILNITEDTDLDGEHLPAEPIDKEVRFIFLII